MPRPSADVNPLSLHDALPIWWLQVYASFRASITSTHFEAGPASPLVGRGRGGGRVRFENGMVVNLTTPLCLRGSCRFSPVLPVRSEEHTSELQSRGHLVCRLL